MLLLVLLNVVVGRVCEFCGWSCWRMVLLIVLESVDVDHGLAVFVKFVVGRAGEWCC